MVSLSNTHIVSPLIWCHHQPKYNHVVFVIPELFSALVQLCHVFSWKTCGFHFTLYAQCLCFFKVFFTGAFSVIQCTCDPGYRHSGMVGCIACNNSTPCEAGQFRGVCTNTSDGPCTNCTGPTSPPQFSTLGVASLPYQDSCPVICNPGWSLSPSPGSRYCCSDNSDQVGDGSSCTCSAGFRGLDGVDCTP